MFSKILYVMLCEMLLVGMLLLVKLQAQATLKEQHSSMGAFHVF